jgi:hypothetical protein
MTHQRAAGVTGCAGSSPSTCLWRARRRLVEVAELLHERVLDVLDTHAAHDPGDQRSVRVELSVGEELREGRAVVEVAMQLGVVEAGQPLDHRIELGGRATLPLDFGDVVRVDRGDRDAEDPMHEGRIPPCDVAAPTTQSASQYIGVEGAR